MDKNIVDFEYADRDQCLCARRNLGILKDVHKAYVERMEIIERMAGANKMQRQAVVLRQWVVDLEGQNTLLARAVENLETEATDKLTMARRTREELQNKEETLRVQSESLAVAESRIAALTARVAGLRRDLDDKALEIRTLSQSNCCDAEKTDVSVDVQTQGYCTCGMKDENMKLTEKNEALENELRDCHQKISDLEEALSERDSLDTEYKLQIDMKEQELHSARQQLADIEKENNCRNDACETLKVQLQQTQVLLNDKIAELVEVKQLYHTQEITINTFKDELDKANGIIKGNLVSVEEAKRQLVCSEQRLSAVECELQRVREEQKNIDDCYKQKACRAASLRSQLQEARARGAALCAESRRALAALRRWAQRARAAHREQQEKIEQQEALIQSLRHEKQINSERASTSSYASCQCIRKIEAQIDERTKRSKCDCTASASGRTAGYSRSVTKRLENDPKCRLCTEERHIESEYSSCNDMAGSSSSPVPPRSLSKKKLAPCGDRNCKYSTSVCDASVQRPMRRDAALDPPCPPLSPPCPSSPTIMACTVHRDYELYEELSPDGDLMERVERLHEALVDGQRRWSRSRRGD